jgi:hypothetical protein
MTKPDPERSTATGRMAGTGAGHDGEGGGRCARRCRDARRRVEPEAGRGLTSW